MKKIFDDFYDDDETKQYYKNSAFFKENIKLCRKLFPTYDDLQKENKKLKKVLEYYADVLRIRCRMKKHDNGQKAREILGAQ